MTLGWGLIGPGRHADRLILPAISQSASSELVAICHYNKEKADFYAKRHNAKRSYTTLEEMIRDPEIDVVDVATPETMHKEQVIKAAQAGKHVRCEFPMAVTVDDCKEMLEVCNKAGVKISLGFAWAHHPAHMEMRRRIASGEFGQIDFIEGQYNMPWGGGLMGGQTYWKVSIPPFVPHSQAWKHDPSYQRASAVFHQGIVIYVFRYLLGREVEEVTAFTDPKGEKKSIACLKFEGDIYGFALGSHIFPFGSRSITVYGKEGRMKGVDTLAWGTTGDLEVMKLRAEASFLFREMGKEVPGRAQATAGGLYFEGEKCQDKIEYHGANMWVDTIDMCNKCIQEGGEPLPSGIDGLRERQITDAIVESGRTGKAVKVKK